MFGLYTLIESAVFFVNAICILHEERFLVKYGLAPNAQQVQGFGNEEQNLKQKLVHFITSVRTVMRYPLIFINIVMIVILTLFG